MNVGDSVSLFRCRLRQSLAQRCALLLLLGSVAPEFIFAAEFDLNGPTIELRRVQFCSGCEKPLAVTTIPSGAKIQCTHCNAVQHRIPTRYLLTRVYQVCPKCGVRMDVGTSAPEKLIRCGSCRHVQAVQAETFRGDTELGGTGYLPRAPSVQAVAGTSGASLAEPTRRPARPSGPVLEDSDISSDLTAPGVFAETRTQVVRQRLGPTSTGPLSVRELDASMVSPEEFTAEPVVNEDGSDQPVDTAIAAVVNGYTILRADVDRLLAGAMNRARTQLGRAALTSKGEALLRRKRAEFTKKALDTLIDRALVLEAAERDGIQPAREDLLARAQDLRREKGNRLSSREVLEQARIDLILDEVVRRRTATSHEIRPADIRTYYEQNRASFREPRLARLRSLVIYRHRDGRERTQTARQLASEVVDRLGTGVPFATLVQEYSEGPNAARQGMLTMGTGEWVPTAILAGPVREAMQAGADNKLVGPIVLTSSIVFVEVLAVREAQVAPLAKVSDHIQQRLRGRAARDAFDAWVASLRTRADIQLR